MLKLKEMVLREVVERFGHEEVVVQRGIKSNEPTFTYRPKPREISTFGGSQEAGAELPTLDNAIG